MEMKAAHQITAFENNLNEWTVGKLGDLLSICHGKSQKEVEVADGPYPILATGGQIGTASRPLFSKPSVLIGRKGTINQPQYMDTPFWSVDTLFYSLILGQNSAKFLYYKFLNINWLQFNEASGVPSLNARTIENIPVSYPSPAEQLVIADVLSDIDALIAGLEKLIAKKRDLKQAAMQQLLTGQTRLPGFSGEWASKTLGSVFEITAGKSKSAYVIEGGNFVICDMGSVSVDGRLITSKRTNYRGDFLAKGDLVMPKDDIGGGKIIGRVGYVDASEKYVLGDHVYRLHAREGDPLFFCYLINHNSINSALRKKVIGSAQLGLGRRSVEEQEIPFPSPVEQTAIACVLFDIDRALVALEFRLAKTRDLKQGMMQELLTGRTRLV